MQLSLFVSKKQKSFNVSFLNFSSICTFFMFKKKSNSLSLKFSLYILSYSLKVNHLYFNLTIEKNLDFLKFKSYNCLFHHKILSIIFLFLLIYTMVFLKILNLSFIFYK